MTIKELKKFRESENKVEFKEAKGGNYSFNGGDKPKHKERRRCIIGYVTALANEGGGYLVFGMHDIYPHEVVGTNQSLGAIGKLEQDIYREKQIRVEIEELYEDNKRVLVLKVPGRPIATVFKFEDVALMRVGEELLPMSDEQYIKIIQEQEPDFSVTICNGLTLSDLEEVAVQKMKQSYASKQRNSGLPLLSTTQILADLKLLNNDKLNYAALILLAKKEAIAQYLPQSKIIWEYRNSEAQIPFDSREIIEEPLFIGIDKIWSLINQPTVNRKHPIQSGAYIFDIYDFNEAVIREAVLNALAHRDYSITSEVVIKQYPTQIIISNPGGFPKGVNIENLLTVNSTPRSRLMTEILEKTGLVERSGQGVDKIYSITLSEGKAEPDYSHSDLFQVMLILKAEILDKAFYTFINLYQKSNQEPKLGVEQIITLFKINRGIFQHLKTSVLAQLEKSGLIKRVSGHSNRYTLSDMYDQLVNDGLKIGKRYLVKEVENLIIQLQGNVLKIGELEDRLSEFINRNQIKYLINKLTEDNVIQHQGVGKGTKYLLSESYAHLRGDLLSAKIVHTLREKYENITMKEYEKDEVEKK